MAETVSATMIKQLNLPKNFICCSCEQPLETHTPLNDVANRPIQKGTLMVCGLCGAFLRVGDGGLERLTKRQFVALPEMTQKALVVAKLKIEEARNN